MKNKVIRNEIIIEHTPDERGRFGYENINIEIKNTSFGALITLQKDLDVLSEKWSKINNECWHPITAAYADLLKKLSIELKNKLKK